MLENKDDKLILGLPKGSLEAATTALFAKAGYKIEISSRSLYPTINDPEIECMLLRAQEMAMFVEEEMLDCGPLCRLFLPNSSQPTDLMSMPYRAPQCQVSALRRLSLMPPIRLASPTARHSSITE